MKDKKILIIGLLVIFTLILIFVVRISKNEEINDGVESIITNINLDNSDEKIVWSDYEDSVITLSKSITINSEGVYNVTGTIDDGMITIDVDGNVKLVLNNVNITNSNGPAIYVKNASNVVIYLEEGSINTLTDSSSYEGYEEDVSGVIYSKDDIIFDGLGTLNIKANFYDGIVGKDDLKIINGIYNIEALDDGIRGKDSVYILDGEININAGGDGIKSTNEEDSSKGYVKIEGGIININSNNDGIEAIFNVLIDNGSINIKTNNGSSNTSIKNGWSSSIGSGAKGIKADNNIVIVGGNIVLDTSDDSIHSNNYVGVSNANITINSGDDGIHADNEIIIDSGFINIEKSYEGIESAKVTINGGNIKLVASDDGINVAGGADNSGFGRPGENSFVNNSNYSMNISGGNIVIDATGDGLDANGSIYITGGNIIVDGPTNNGNGALDYDGVFNISGGSLIAIGASGMAQGVSNTSMQNGVLINFSSTYNSGSVVKILDSSDNEIISYKANKSFSSFVYSSSNLIKGNYKIYVDDILYTEFSVSSVSTMVGQGGMGGPGMNQNMGQRQRMR